MENKRLNYHFEYVDENEFRKKERSVRKYNMLAYTKNYELKLPTDALFSKVHGDITLHYTVYEDSKIVLLTNITPDSILEEGHRSELATYKGVMISKTNAQKDMFKVNLLNALNQK